MVTNVLIVGVGGQGIILAGDVLARTAALAGLDVKKSDVHGMAQRGGAVSSHVRFGKKVYSPLIPDREADILMAAEILEAIRWLPFLRPEARIVVSTQRIDPPAVFRGEMEYPSGILDRLRGHDKNLIHGDCLEIAVALGNPRTATMVLLGALSTLIDFNDMLWKNAVTETMPEMIVEINMKAFSSGRELARKFSRSS